MGESNYQWAVLLEKYVEKTISSEELTELHSQMDSSHLKRKQFEQVTGKDYYINRLKLLLATDEEADLKRFTEMLNKHVGSDRSADNVSAVSTPIHSQTNSNNSKKINLKGMLTRGLVLNIRQRKYGMLAIIALAVLLVSAFLIAKYLLGNYTDLKRQPIVVDYHSMSEPEIKSYPYIRIGNLREIKYKEMSDGVLFDSMGIVITKQSDKIVIDTNTSYRNNQKFEIILVTAPATTQKLRLPDGSLFTMDAMSSICNNSTEFGLFRSVQIYGEAYCEVKPRKRTRFNVYLNDGLEVGVMGTQFNVRSYGNENPTVALKTGEVRLKRGNEQLIMHPGEVVELTKNKTFKLIANAKVENDIFWINRELNIEDKNIYQVMHLVGTYFNRPVRFADSIFLGDLASGKISLEDDIAGVDSTIQDLYPVRIEIKKDSLIIYKQRQ